MISLQETTGEKVKNGKSQKILKSEEKEKEKIKKKYMREVSFDQNAPNNKNDLCMKIYVYKCENFIKRFYFLNHFNLRFKFI